MNGKITINDISFEPAHGIKYRRDYIRIVTDIKEGKLDEEREVYRKLLKDDLWFLLYFGLKINTANHPFVVQACKDVENGNKTNTLDLWAREHFKSTIITMGEVIQIILRNKEERIGIFSHTRPAAKSFLRRIKLVFETSDFIRWCFPDVLYENPSVESPKWSEDDGLICKRDGFYNEATIEAWGLLEGMPTGKHFTCRFYDDIVTADHAASPDTMRKLKDMFDLSQNLGTVEGTHRVVGTHYHHEDVLMYLRKKKDIHGNLVYTSRIKAATENGHPNGAPVFLSQKKIDELKTNEYLFNCQQLLNPTPIGVQKLNGEFIKTVPLKDIPLDAIKVMVIDPAGDSKDNKGDSWAILCFAVDGNSIDGIGASKIYLVDAVISPLSDSEAIESIVTMYIRNGIISRIGIEKVGLSSVEIHVANALKAKGRHISIEDGSLVLLKPAGRTKWRRIEQALAWPLNNGKIFFCDVVPVGYRERIMSELNKFPYWHDDAIDAFSYLYDVIKDYRFMPKEYLSELVASVNKQYKPMNGVAGY